MSCKAQNEPRLALPDARRETNTKLKTVYVRNKEA